MKSGNEEHVPFTRKKPKQEYVEPEVITMPDVNVKVPDDPVRVEPTMFQVKPEREPKDLGVITWDTVEDPHIVGTANELAARYVEPKRITMPEPQPRDTPEQLTVEPTEPHVGEPEKKPKTLDDETKRLWRT